MPPSRGNFYPACKGQIEDEDLLDESYVEHDGAKVMIAELLDSSPDSEFYDAKVTVLSEMIKHHVKEEERRAEGLFAEAREAGLDMDALADRLEARKQQLLKQFAGRQAAAAADAQLHGPQAGAERADRSYRRLMRAGSRQWQPLRAAALLRRGFCPLTDTEDL